MHTLSPLCLVPGHSGTWLKPLGADTTLSFTGDTQALLNRASWEYALANAGIGLGFNWSNLGLANTGIRDLELGLGGMDALRFTGINEYGSILDGAAMLSMAMSNFREGTSLPTVVTSSSMGGGGGDTPGESSAPGSGEGVRGAGAGGQGRALEGWRGWSM